MPERRTLYEDWQARREQLARLPYWTGEQHDVEARVLDYLLKRFRDAPEGARPARFPLAKDFYVDHRAIVVLHHLGGGRSPVVATSLEAQARVRAVLRRMGEERGDRAPAECEADITAWSDTFDDPADVLRMTLCDSDPLIRIVAIVRLGTLGTLDDIGLLADLLALPPSADEHPRERAAMVHSMQRLAGTTPEPFELSDEVHPPPVQADTKGPPSQVVESAAEIEPPDWTCPKCGEEVPGSFEVCWNCGTSVDGVEDAAFRGTDEE